MDGNKDISYAHVLAMPRLNREDERDDWKDDEWKYRKVGKWPYRYRDARNGQVVVEGGAVFVAHHPNSNNRTKLGFHELEIDADWIGAGAPYPHDLQVRVRSMPFGVIRRGLTGTRWSYTTTSGKRTIHADTMEELVERMVMCNVFTSIFNLEQSA